MQISDGENEEFWLDRYKISSNGNLHIIDVKPSDSGRYQCSAKNPLTGESVNNSQVTILQVVKKPLNSRERHPIFTVYKPPVASRLELLFGKG